MVKRMGKTFCIACNEEKEFCEIVYCCLYGHVPSKDVLEAMEQCEKNKQYEFYPHRAKPPDEIRPQTNRNRANLNEK